MIARQAALPLVAGVAVLVFAAGVGIGLRSLPAPAAAIADPSIYYAPAENLEKIDVALIDSARASIDMAAYVLTDWPVLQALTRAADRGVKLRIYLDGGQNEQRYPSAPFDDLKGTPDVEIRVKAKGGDLMHLKAYAVDGRVLRTGAANFSASGEKRQDNDLIIIESPAAAETFKRNFETIFAHGAPLPRTP